ncbi:MAG: chlorite dismutase family protein [Burkholderiales bacterium]|nr:chlorite dismutase family protein [Burkholderiales bacterium]
MTAAALARLYHFVAGNTGPWQIEQAQTLCGDPLPAATRIAVQADTSGFQSAAASWSLRGITSNERYVTRSEKSALVARQESLGRAQATRAALIPIRKNAAWWALVQDERRQILEEQSRHIAIGLKYLPAIARRLHHCRDLGDAEPFDFITWFEYAPEHGSAFDELVAALRASPEWQYVEREADFRLVHSGV